MYLFHEFFIYVGTILRFLKVCIGGLCMAPLTLVVSVMKG